MDDFHWTIAFGGRDDWDVVLWMRWKMRLIDADTLVKSIDKEIVHKWEIALAPTVDPVKHGHWIEANDISSSPFDAMKRCLCSECREWGVVTNYCPNCGAKMDEVSDEINN